MIVAWWVTSVADGRSRGFTEITLTRMQKINSGKTMFWETAPEGPASLARWRKPRERRSPNEPGPEGP